MLQRKVSLSVELSQLDYGDSAVVLRWNDVRLTVTYEQLHLESNPYLLLDELKAELRGVVNIILRCHLITGIVEKIEVDGESSAIQELAQAKLRIERLVDSIRTAAATGSLTLSEARQMLRDHQFDPPEDTTHRILSKIIDCMALETIKKSLVLPLSQLRYDQDGVTFRFGNARLEVPEGLLKSENRPIFETTKDLLKGNMIFEMQSDCLLKWERSTSCMLVGQVGDVIVTTAGLDPEASKAFTRVEQFVDDIRTAATTGSLTITEAIQILHNHEFDPPEDKTHTILSKIIDCMPPQTIKESLVLPLSQLRFDEDGVTFRFGSAQLIVPEGVLKLEGRSIFETIKDLLKGNMIFELQTKRLLKWGGTSCMLVGQVGDVIVIRAGLESEASEALTRIERLVDAIRTAAATGSLTITEANQILHNHEFDPPEATTHTILSTIIDCMPFQAIKQSLVLPLSQLRYDEDGVTFRQGDTQLKAPKEVLKFEVRSIFETIKDRFEGNMIFELKTDCLLKWERSTSRMLVGQVEDVRVITAALESGASKAFTSLRCEIICESVTNSTDRSIEQIERLLTEWGLSSSDEEVGQQIASAIPAWVRENDYTVPLKQVTFYDPKITVPLSGKTISISSEGLPFKPLAVAEKIKDTFEGDIRIHLTESFRFVWKQSGFTVERDGKLLARTDVDREALEILKKLCALYISLWEQHESFPSDFSDPDEVFRTFKKPEGNVPSTYRVHSDYDRHCITILEELATTVYIMSEHLWFHIGKYLVWERPAHTQATYIFNWPQRDWELVHLVGRILASKSLEDVRRSKESGYVTRVFHEGGTNNWKSNLRRKVH